MDVIKKPTRNHVGEDGKPPPKKPPIDRCIIKHSKRERTKKRHDTNESKTLEVDTKDNKQSIESPIKTQARARLHSQIGQVRSQFKPRREIQGYLHQRSRK
ncbi:hypothetical protein A4A49_20300 [Nicotiana attenuata]|uniref:Uncharacterized protein n=1 Tax=Nicotiana attenuata TaxID=49451 RepID=A0A1J6IZY0_NICAT|nr:hypothetical protein A4A49_20300 [Nicotiana attenuata]